MFFEDHRNSYVLSGGKFLKNIYTGVGSLRTTHLRKGVIPFTCSSNAFHYNVLLSKMYSEYQERNLIAFKGEAEGECQCINILSPSKKLIRVENISYGPSKSLGFIDTTGTASGNNDSYNVIKKAVSELLEKNELFLFWYMEMGNKLTINSYIYKELKKQNLVQFKNYFYLLRNLSNWPTVIHIIFKNKKLISSGICCNPDINKAILGAISEAKTLYFMDRYQKNSIFTPNDSSDDEIHKKLSSNINDEISFKFDDYKYNSNLDIWLSKEIKSMFVGMLNTRYNSGQGKTISVFSPELIKCVPTKENLKYCLDIPLIKKYENFCNNEVPNCLIL